MPHPIGNNESFSGAIWSIARPDPSAVRKLESEAALSPLLALALAARGISSPSGAREFLNASLAANLGDPFGLKDMKEAADRLVSAIERGERIAVFGDYDVDGITATVVALRLLRNLGADAFYYIPHRVDEGYGMSREAIDQIAAEGARLILTVDNGISSIEEVEYARSLGVDCIVTDHHQPADRLPRACAVVNPSRGDCTYGFPHLSGVGVAFKLAHAVLRRIGARPSDAKAFLKSLLDLVALGTVADVVPLVGENRALVRAGLARLERTENPGLEALMSLCNLNRHPLATEAITFHLAPRLNAAGRTDHASIAVELLTTSDPDRAFDLAHRLDELNNHRRALERRIFDQALRLIPVQCDLESDPVLVVAGDGWHLGVVGIVASRLSNHFSRPVIVLSQTDGLARGSARSTDALDIYEALNRCSALLETFGGHPQAAGLSLAAERVDDLRECINTVAGELIADEEQADAVAVDGACEPDDLTVEAVEDLAALEPCGIGNPSPLFALLGAEIIREPRTVGLNHLKLAVAAGHQDFDVIGFGMAGALEKMKRIAGQVDLLFRPAVSNWSGSPRVELHLHDFRPSGG